jgi:frataxin-like iron-binding protein CyaY
VGSFSQKEIWLTLEVDGKKFGSKALLPDLWEHTNKQMRTKQLIEMLRLLEHQLENEIMKEVNK